MKNLFKSLFAFTIILTACQPEKNVIAPIEDAKVSANNLREGIVATMPKHYQLIKHGTTKLAYFDDGRLQKVTYTSTQRGTSGVYAQYKYGLNSVVSTLYYNNAIAEVSTYLLDNKGRCYESKQVELIPYGPNQTLEKTSEFTYLYNAKGQLLTRTNKKIITEKTTFVWNAGGDLTNLTGFNFNNGRAYEPVKSDLTLYYDQPTGDPILADLSPINCEAANLPDPYLMIFGKSGKNLVKLITNNSNLGGKYFNYTMNADGYITKRDQYDMSSGALTETKAYDYLVTNLGFNL